MGERITKGTAKTKISKIGKESLISSLKGKCGDVEAD